MNTAKARTGHLTGRRAALVWLAALAGVAITTAAAGIGSFTQPDEPGLVAAARVLLVSSLAIVGALTATRQPRNPIGWVLWLSALALALGLAIDTYATASLTLAGGQLPGTTWLAWLHPEATRSPTLKPSTPAPSAAIRPMLL